MKAPKTYRDVFVCPFGHKRVIVRRLSSAGRTFLNYCTKCRCSYDALAGTPEPSHHKYSAQEAK